MSPERQAFKNMEEWLENGRNPETKQKLIDEAVKAFHEDHPEVRMLFFTPDNRLEVNVHGEHPAYKYFAEELHESPLGTPAVAKLKKCLEIFEDLYRKMQ